MFVASLYSSMCISLCVCATSSLVYFVMHDSSRFVSPLFSSRVGWYNYMLVLFHRLVDAVSFLYESSGTVSADCSPIYLTCYSLPLHYLDVSFTVYTEALAGIANVDI